MFDSKVANPRKKHPRPDCPRRFNACLMLAASTCPTVEGILAVTARGETIAGPKIGWAKMKNRLSKRVVWGKAVLYAES